MKLFAFMKKVILSLGVFCSVASAQSTIVYSGIKNLVIPTNFDGIYLDLDTGTVGGPELTGLDINPFFGGLGIANTANFQAVRSGTNILDPYLNLALGTSVNSSLNYATGEGGTDRNHIGVASNQFHVSTVGYIGFRLTKNSGGAPVYGWMRVSLTANTSGALIKDWAYENNGGAILVGAIPEPSAGLITALSGVLLLTRRKRLAGS